MEQEQERGITITAAATTCFWRDHRINIIDTPGPRRLHHRGRALPARARRRGRGVLRGRRASSRSRETVWRQADRYRVPRIAFINKWTASAPIPTRCVRADPRAPAGAAVVVQLPIGLEDEFTGVIDLIAMKALVVGRRRRSAPTSVDGEIPGRAAPRRPRSRARR